MHDKLCVDDHVAHENGDRVEERSPEADDEHRGDVEKKVADGDEEGSEGSLLHSAVVHHQHPVLRVDKNLKNIFFVIIFVRVRHKNDVIFKNDLAPKRSDQPA